MIAVLVPSRGRPEAIVELRAAFADTTTGLARLVVLVDDDDPALPGYLNGGPVIVAPRLRLGGTLNHWAPQFAACYPAVGFMGDDHRPRTHGWDNAVWEALRALHVGVAYGNDLIHREGLPTAAFLTSNIVTTLGYMVPPGATHLWLDNFWLHIGQQTGLAYLPDVTIEHLHPIAGKAEWDAGYLEVNDEALFDADRAVFETWVATQGPAAVARLKGLA